NSLPSRLRIRADRDAQPVLRPQGTGYSLQVPLHSRPIRQRPDNQLETSWKSASHKQFTRTHLRRIIPGKARVSSGDLDPAVPGELWPEADHQSCVFPILESINQQILDAMRRLRKSMSPRGRAGRKKKRGGDPAATRPGTGTRPHPPPSP